MGCRAPLVTLNMNNDLPTQSMAAMGTLGQLGRHGGFVPDPKVNGGCTGAWISSDVSGQVNFLGAGRGGLVCDDVCLALDSILLVVGDMKKS